MKLLIELFYINVLSSSSLTRGCHLSYFQIYSWQIEPTLIHYSTIRKTKTFLSVFDREQRPIQYFALDLSRQGLTESIIKLSEALHESEFLTVTGLLGTYEDCILWLNQPENLNGLSSITFLWMGNSIANFPHHSDASAFLGRFREACQLSRINCSFILSTDICDRSSRMNEAYNLDKPELQAWLSNGLKHANTALGGKVFRFEDWKIITEFDPQEHNLNTYYTALFDIKLNLKSVKGKPIVFSKGTRIPIITSGKWSEEIMGEICVDAGFRIQQRWKDDSRVYCVYHLASIGG